MSYYVLRFITDASFTVLPSCQIHPRFGFFRCRCRPDVSADSSCPPPPAASGQQVRVVQHVPHRRRRRGRGRDGRHPEHARGGRVLQTRGHAELLLGDQLVALLHLLPLLGAPVLEPDLDLQR